MEGATQITKEKKVNETKAQSKPEFKSQNQRIAIILVRGLVGVQKSIKDTLTMLRLHRKNQCVIITMNSVNKGMLHKVKDYVTWGEISDEVFNKLIVARGEEWLARKTDSKNKYEYKSFKANGKEYKPYFRLNPPRKGFGRKGIKMPFKLGGGLGDRADKMNDLLLRMI
jgi:large subunit ribosomal protein L30